MIKILNGRIIESLGSSVVIDVSGFGLHVRVLTTEMISEVGNKETLYTNMIITENNISIYGFKEKPKCEIFEKLIKIKGIGPSIAINILTEISDLQHIDSQNLLKIRGVGSKLADTILNEFGNRNAATVSIKEFVKLGFKKEDVLKVVNELGISSSDSDYSKKILERLCEANNNDSV